MILKRVILKNFRSHTYFEFIPEEEGITNIRGANGAGKSSIVEGFFWSLYGSKVKTLSSKGYIKDFVDPKEEESGVISEFFLGDKMYQIDRHFTSKSGATAVYVYEMVLDDDLNPIDKIQIAGPGVRETDSFIVSLIGMDDKGFSFSTYIQQKQVDDVVSASKANRSQVIEELLGIDTVTSAEKLARAKVRELKSAASIVEGQKTSSLEDELRIKENLEKEIEELTKALLETKQELDEKRPRQASLEEIVSDIRGKREELLELNTKKKMLESSLKDSKVSLRENLETLKTLGKEKSLTYNLEDISKSLADLTSEQREKQKEFNAIEARFIRNEETLSKSVNLQELGDSFDPKAASLDDINEKAKLCETKIRETEQILAVLNQQVKESTEVIKLFDTGQSNCPTCGQVLSGDHKHKFENTLENASERIKEDKDKLEKLKKVESVLKRRKELLTAYEELEKEKEKARSEQSDLRMKKLELETVIEGLDTKIQVLQRQELEAKNQREQKATRERMFSLVETLEKRIAEYEVELADVETAIENKKAEQSDLSLTELDKELNALNKSITDIRIKGAEDATMLKNKKAELIRQEDYCRQLEKLEKQEKELMKELEVQELGQVSLNRFHSYRIDTSVPQLSVIASDLLNDLSEGTLSTITFDQSFRAEVRTKDDVVRDVQLLSGGELSLVALSIRLAVSLFLSDGKIPLLILDEVFAAQSKDRTEVALEKIRQVCPDTQIILIAHSNFLDELAEKTIFL